MLPIDVRPFIIPSVRRVYLDLAQSQTLQQKLSAAQNEVKILTRESAQLRTSYKRKFEEAERGWKDKHDQLSMSYSAKKVKLKRLAQEMDEVTKNNEDLIATTVSRTDELARVRRERASWIRKYDKVKAKTREQDTTDMMETKRLKEKEKHAKEHGRLWKNRYLALQNALVTNHTACVLYGFSRNFGVWSTHSVFFPFQNSGPSKFQFETTTQSLI
jgi:hypothetical protein